MSLQESTMCCVICVCVSVAPCVLIEGAVLIRGPLTCMHLNYTSCKLLCRHTSCCPISSRWNRSALQNTLGPGCHLQWEQSLVRKRSVFNWSEPGPIQIPLLFKVLIEEHACAFNITIVACVLCTGWHLSLGTWQTRNCCFLFTWFIISNHR